MKIKFKVDKFIDYAGNTRTFVVSTAQKSGFIGIGFSCQRAGDTNNVDLGIRIATGKAEKTVDNLLNGINSRFFIYSTENVPFDVDFIYKILDNEIALFKKDPGAFLASYNKDKELYLKNSKK